MLRERVEAVLAKVEKGQQVCREDQRIAESETEAEYWAGAADLLAEVALDLREALDGGGPDAA